MRHDARNTPFQIRAADSRHTRKGRLDAVFAYLENALRIHMRLAAGLDNRFVARAFAIFDETIA